MKIENWQRAGFGLYVHWPFCQSKCPYCDFNSHVSAQIDQNDWAKAYELELSRTRPNDSSRTLRSIYFGGGTPSLMSAKVVGRVIEAASKRWVFSNDIEITLEANPSSVEAKKFSEFKSVGVNRVSIGVQALNDPDLIKLGRLHTAKEARYAIEIASHTFDRFNFDLIYARQDQSLKAWGAELDEAISLSGGHLSLYQLTIEPETVFFKRAMAGKLKGLPGEELSADMFELTQSMTQDAGLAAYEVSNHAKRGHESAHNLIYWRGGDYVGIGPGAHGRVTVDGQRLTSVAARDPNDWLSGAANQTGTTDWGSLTEYDRCVEYLMMSLRLTEGCDLDVADGICSDVIDQKSLNEMLEEGFLAKREKALVPTMSGRMVLNQVIERLVA